MRKDFFLETLIEKVWYSKNIFSLLLFPLSLIYIYEERIFFRNSY